MLRAYMQLFDDSNLNHWFTLLSQMDWIIHEKSIIVKKKSA